MFKILGGDGKEYGPVTAETLRQWVNEGRANAQTQVRAEGAANWVPLGQAPEFAALFSAPPIGMTSAVGGMPVGRGRTSGMAITSLVMGILSIASCGLTLILTSPLGLILGLVAMSKIKKSQGQLTGWGLALAGTIVSGVSLLLIPIFAAMLLPALAKAKAKAQTINCVNNLKQLGLAVRLYSDDNNDIYPAGTNWCDALMTYAGTPKIYQCPGDRAELQSGYAYNSALSGIAEADIAFDTVLIFESDSGWNASGGKELMITQPRHHQTYVIGFADGSVQQISEARLSQLRWNPTNAPQPSTR